jgi:hypothetical protein
MKGSEADIAGGLPRTREVVFVIHVVDAVIALVEQLNIDLSRFGGIPFTTLRSESA